MKKLLSIIVKIGVAYLALTTLVWSGIGIINSFASSLRKVGRLDIDYIWDETCNNAQYVKKNIHLGKLKWF